jgi:acetamidase/formamidase
MPSTSVRIDVGTHRELKRLAAALGASVGDTVALAVRRLRQDQIAADLRRELSASEVAWLDADLG